MVTDSLVGVWLQWKPRQAGAGRERKIKVKKLTHVCCQKTVPKGLRVNVRAPMLVSSGKIPPLSSLLLGTMHCGKVQVLPSVCKTGISLGYYITITLLPQCFSEFQQKIFDVLN